MGPTPLTARLGGPLQKTSSDAPRLGPAGAAGVCLLHRGTGMRGQNTQASEHEGADSATKQRLCQDRPRLFSAGSTALDSFWSRSGSG